MEKSPKSTLKYTEDGEKSMEKSGEKWRKVEKSGEKWRNAKLGFHYKIMNPPFFGHYPGFCKKTVCCVQFLYLVVQNMTKWKSLSEESGEKSKMRWRKVEKSPTHTLKYTENGEKSSDFSPLFSISWHIKYSKKKVEKSGEKWS